MTERVDIRRLPTGVRGLDDVLGGGVPELSFNLIAGAPGCGKTTLAHQFMFANATVERPAVYFSVYGEPPVKMLRYQQQFSFFDAAKLEGAIRFVHLGQELFEGGLGQVFARITKELETSEPRTVIVDSFRSLARAAGLDLSDHEEQLSLEGFVQRLALTLTSYEATTFLVGEYVDYQESRNPVFTVADGIIWLHQTVVRNSVVRRLQVLKVRGQEQIPGMHTVKISNEGMRVFPRIAKPEEQRPAPSEASDVPERKALGIAGLDEMLGGGIPTGYSLLVVGPSGSGKTMLGTQFLLEGIRKGESGVLAVFEKRPEEYLRTSPRGREVQRLIEDAKIELIYIRPLDLSVDETLEELQQAVKNSGATRLVIDSLSGFELALAPAFRDDFRESLYRMVGALTSLGVTVLMTAEIVDSFTELRLSPHGVSFLTDGILLQRYFEKEGAIRKAMAVIKMRASPHSKELREYEIDEHGIVLGDALTTYSGLLTGTAVPTAAARAGRSGDTGQRRGEARARASATKPRTSATKPRASATKPRASATKPRASATKPRASATKKASASKKRSPKSRGA